MINPISYVDNDAIRRGMIRYNFNALIPPRLVSGAPYLRYNQLIVRQQPLSQQFSFLQRE
jgi:hypothetical protein